MFNYFHFPVQVNTRSILPLAILLFLGVAAIFVVTRLTSNQSAPDSGAATDVRTVLTLTSPSSVQGIANGSNITISLGLQNTTGVNVGELVLNYDPDVLAAQTISERTNVLALNKNMNNTTGQLTVDIANTGSSDFPEDTILVDFVFQVLDSSDPNTTVSTNPSTTLGTPNELQSSGLGSIVLRFSVTSCGDGVIQNPNDDGDPEQCDDGSQNGVACTPNGSNNCQYCTNTCTLQTVTGGTTPPPVTPPVTPPTTPPVGTTVTCYRCTAGLSDGNSCESFSATGSCPANSSASPTACGVAAGGSCPVQSSGGTNPPPTTPVGGTLPETGILDDGSGILLGFLFVVLGLAVYKYMKPNN